MKEQTELQKSYTNGLCPDCYELIGDDVEAGCHCFNCGHVFWVEKNQQ